jgi:hypothetical protein
MTVATVVVDLLLASLETVSPSRSLSTKLRSWPGKASSVSDYLSRPSASPLV